MLVAVFSAVGCSSTGALAIVGAVSADATVGAAYNSTLAVTGGTGSYMWTVANLPPGVTASGTSSSTLVLSGTPTTVGNYTISATVTDTKRRTDTFTGGIDVTVSAVLAINGTLPLTGSVGNAYSGTLTASGGTAPYTWTLENLPAGLTAAGTNTSTIAVSGSPTKGGTFIVAITLTDSLGATAKSSIPITISSAAGLTITGSLPATGSVGVAYSGSLMATGGTGPYTWLLSNLPQGVGESGLDTVTVTVSGSPMMAGSYNVTALVTDEKNNTALYSETVIIGAGQTAAADSACTTAPIELGNEANLAQPIAFVMNQTDANALPMSWAGSFRPDGTGKIAAADVDEISLASGPASYRVNLAGSSYSYGTDGSGCLYLALDGVNAASAPSSATAHTPNLSLGGSAKSALVAASADGARAPTFFAARFTMRGSSAGSLIQCDSGDRHITAAGRLFAQSPSTFALSTLAPRFAFGVEGWYFAPDEAIERAAMAGSIAFGARQGALVSGVADNNIGGDVSGELTGAQGSLAAPALATGRGTGSYSIATARGDVSFDFAYYVIDGDDFIFISTDAAQAGNFALAGRALAGADPASPLAGEYEAHMNGVEVNSVARSASNAAGGVRVADDSMTQFAWIGGTMANVSSANFSGVVAMTDSASGRTIFNSPSGALPVAYLVAPGQKESIAGFLVGVNAAAESGVLVIASPTPTPR